MQILVTVGYPFLLTCVVFLTNPTLLYECVIKLPIQSLAARCLSRFNKFSNICLERYKK